MVALPFERLFGLAADAADPTAVARVLDIKGRTERPRPIAVALPDREALGAVVASFPPLAERLADRHWPGPLTLLVPAAPGLPAPLVGPGGLVGVRLPGPCPAGELARALGRPITATSANRTGAPDALDHAALAALAGIDLVLAGRVPGPPGSTVVDASGDRAVVLRAGAIDLGEEPA